MLFRSLGGPEASALRTGAGARRQLPLPTPLCEAAAAAAETPAVAEKIYHVFNFPMCSHPGIFLIYFVLFSFSLNSGHDLLHNPLLSHPLQSERH